MQKILLNNNGKTKKGLKIAISSILNNSSEKIWNKILNIETLIEICKPMAKFKLMSKEKFIKWEPDQEYIFKLFVYGFIPLGNHVISFEKIDKENKIILSKEHNNIVKIWNHKIKMDSAGNGSVKYTDEVEIYAGIFTLLVAFWAELFYKHRQKNWVKIAKTLE